MFKCISKVVTWLLHFISLISVITWLGKLCGDYFFENECSPSPRNKMSNNQENNICNKYRQKELRQGFKCVIINVLIQVKSLEDVKSVGKIDFCWDGSLAPEDR